MARRKHTSQAAFDFNRPQSKSAQPVRRRHRKGRIRHALKNCVVVILFGTIPLSVWAWKKGHVATFAEHLADEMVAASLDAGFALERVHASGQGRTPDGAILEALGVSAGDPLVAMNMEKLRNRVEDLPWVKRAVITREWPSTLKVWIEERTPFARWQFDGDVVLVDETAAAIRGADVTEFSDLPLVVGPGAPEEAVKLFAILAQKPNLARQVIAAVRVGNRRWDLEFDNGLKLKLPEKTNTYGPSEAWEAFSEMEHDQDVMLMDVAVVDLRLPDRVVLRLTPEGMKSYQAKNDQGT